MCDCSLTAETFTVLLSTLSCYEGEREAEKVNYVEFPRRGSSLSLSLLLCALNRKIIEVKIIDDEEYEKNKAFTIELGEPVLLEIGQKHGGCLGLNLYSMTLRNHLSANRARLSLIA